MTTDSPVATAFVAAPDHWPRNGATPRAIVVHMAEGGGTVSWLTRDDGNSSHYVVEYSGRVVQMVREAEAAGSMNPRLTRTTDDAPFTTAAGELVTYGRTALDAAGISADPNRYAIAIEVEGFASAGPNGAQADQLERLVADIRRRRGPLHLLGHRDQQSYKACPGHLVPWTQLGGHGAAGQLEVHSMSIYQATPRSGSFQAAAGHAYKGLRPEGDGWVVQRSWTPEASTRTTYDLGLARVAGTATPSSLVRVSSGTLAGLFVDTATITEVDDPAPPAPDAGELEAARLEGRTAMRDEAIAAATALEP